MSMEKRIEKLEKRYGNREGCTFIIVVRGETRSPDDGAERRHVEENHLCEGCTRNDSLCVLYWNGASFESGPGNTGGDKK